MVGRSNWPASGTYAYCFVVDILHRRNELERKALPHFWPPGFCSARAKQAAFRILRRYSMHGCRPTSEHRAQGIVWLCSRWAGAFTPILAFLLIRVVSWRFAFQVFALAGLVWVWCFRTWYRDPSKAEVSKQSPLLPETSRPRVPHSVPWKKLATSNVVLLLWIQYFAVSWGWSFYITWLPTYVRQERAASIEQSAWLSALPLFLGGFGCLAGGAAIPLLTRVTGNRAAARATIAAVGCVFSGLFLVVSLHVHGAFGALAIIGTASFFNDLALAPAWDACMDAGPYIGSVAGS